MQLHAIIDGHFVWVGRMGVTGEEYESHVTHRGHTCYSQGLTCYSLGFACHNYTTYPYTKKYVFKLNLFHLHICVLDSTV